MSTLLKVLLGGLAVVALLLAAPALRHRAERIVRPGHRVLATVDAGSVRVAIADERDAAGQEWLIGTFTPLREGFHLYSAGLPREGLNGVGRPTLLEIASPDVLAPSGALSADHAAAMLYVPMLADSFPVYPAGPVTLRLPVRRLGAGRRATLSLTFMACSENTCLPPIVGRRVTIQLPS